MGSAYRAAYVYLSEIVEFELNDEFGDQANWPPPAEVARHIELQATRLETRLLDATGWFMASEYESLAD